MENLELAYLLPPPLPPSLSLHSSAVASHIWNVCVPSQHLTESHRILTRRKTFPTTWFSVTSYNCASELCMALFSTSNRFPDNKSGYLVTLRPSPGSTKRSQTMPSFLNWAGAGDWLESCCALVKACSQGGPMCLWWPVPLLAPFYGVKLPQRYSWTSRCHWQSNLCLFDGFFVFSLFKLVKQEYNKKISV